MNWNYKGRDEGRHKKLLRWGDVGCIAKNIDWRLDDGRIAYRVTLKSWVITIAGSTTLTRIPFYVSLLLSILRVFDVLGWLLRIQIDENINFLPTQACAGSPSEISCCYFTSRQQIWWFLTRREPHINRQEMKKIIRQCCFRIGKVFRGGDAQMGLRVV